MKILLVTYDLKKPSQEYKGLYDILKACDLWSHYIESTWIVATEDTPFMLYNKIKPFIDPQDDILVVEIKREYYGFLNKDAWDWFKNLPWQ